MICASEQALIVDKEIYQETMTELESFGCHICDAKEKALLEKFMFNVSSKEDVANAKLNPNVVVNQHIGLQRMLDLKFQKKQLSY